MRIVLRTGLVNGMMNFRLHAVALACAVLMQSCIAGVRQPQYYKGPAVPTPVAARIDYSDIVSDQAGMAYACSILCVPLSDQESRRLGFKIADRAVNTVPADRPVLKKTAYMNKARCSALMADWEEDENLRDLIASGGMNAAKGAGALENDPEAAYFYALNLGISMNHKGLKAISKVGELITMLKAAMNDASLELGGPMRMLGLVYVRAPAWPIGPGDMDEGLDILKRAVEQYPSHPLNRLAYAEALFKSDDAAGAAKEISKAVELSDPVIWGDYAARWKREAADLRKKF
jgi:tetratricopeptide (TPR) repeat protein